MNEWQAVQARFSCRSYENTPVPEDKLSALRDFLSSITSQTGLHMELVHSPEHTLKLAGAMFAGNVHTYAVNIVLSGGKITIKMRKSGNSLQNNDMGIAKYHFAVGAAECGVNGKWQWGDGGEFEVQE